MHEQVGDVSRHTYLTGRIRAAIYLDFDNVFGGLMDVDEEAAMAFAQSPGDWLDRLAVALLPAATYRDFLIRRCYFNPGGWLSSEKYGNEKGRLYFSRFRAFFSRAGFDVVECPPLTSHGKNAADIRIALDVVDALNHATRFEEFILFSGDADFTPVLQRVREHDRRTVVASSSQTAKAYDATADMFFDEQELIDLISPEPAPGVPSDLDTYASVDDGGGPGDVDHEALRQHAVDLTLQIVSSAEGPVLLSALGQTIREELGEVVAATNWLGRGSLSAAIVDERTSHLKRSQFHIWDPGKHASPEDWTDAGLPDVMHEITAVTGAPRLTQEEYRAVFSELARWAAENPFNLTAITKEVRDSLHDLGQDVGRQTLGFIVRGIMYGGVRLDRSPAPDAAEISQAFVQSLMQSARSAQLELTEEEQTELTNWVGYPPEAA